ncbi:MAG: short chain dehydrogenase [Sphingomonas taxi]|uniref:Short chain dehydrogenase n=1 Tax=Sphingomonas taxi TaxID=1549858 RepID=A0A2W5R5J2_9SPHN|nr:MAG: short chain dehydrogenase [Sphingomonas taxi]
MTVTFDFGGKTALVTGGGSGIGLATARAFAAAGANVAVADISEENGTAAVRAIEEAGGTAAFFKVDVGDEDNVRAMVAAVVARFGGLDIAHNNAGIEGKTVPLCELPSDNWRRVIDVDLSSVFYCLKAEIPELLKRGGGAIVNTASASGLIGGYNLSVYTAAKHGVVGLTKAAAMDYGQQGVRVNALCPGPIDTPFIAELPPSSRERLVFATPAGRLGTAEEMAQSVLWLCSDASAYVTGHSLAVDGGVVLGGAGTRFEEAA